MRLVSPVFFKELGQIAVSRRTVVLKAILLAVLLIAFLISIAATATFGSQYEYEASQTGRALFWVLSIIELLAVAVFTPIVAAGVVCGEREANTLGLLFLTRLKARHIVQDKGLSRIVFMLYICITSLPFMFAALLFGGVETKQIVSAIGNVIGLTLFCGGVTMFCSTVLKRFGAALAAAYAMIFVHLVILPTMVGFVVAGFLDEEELALGGIMLLNPGVSLFFTLEGMPFQTLSTILTSYSWIGNVFVGLVTYVLAVGIASALLRHVAVDEPAEGKPSRSCFGALWVIIRTPFLLPVYIFHRGKNVRGNPVAWKDCDMRHDHLKRVLTGITGFLFGLYLLICLMVIADGDFDDEWFHVMMHGCAFCILLVFTAILAAGSFSRQRRAQTFDLLLTTRLSGRSIVMGTFWGLVRSVMPFIGPLLTILLFGALATDFFDYDGYSHDNISMWPAVLNIVLYFCFTMALGMFMSLRRSSTGKAVAWTLGILLFLFVLIPVVSAVSEEVFSFYESGEVVLACSPSYWVFAGPLVDEYEMCGETPGYVAASTGYALITLGLILNMCLSFDRKVGRS